MRALEAVVLLHSAIHRSQGWVLCQQVVHTLSDWFGPLSTLYWYFPLRVRRKVGDARSASKGLITAYQFPQIDRPQRRVLCQQVVEALGRCFVDGCQLRVPLKVGAARPGGGRLATACQLHQIDHPQGWVDCEQIMHPLCHCLGCGCLLPFAWLLCARSRSRPPLLLDWCWGGQ